MPSLMWTVFPTFQEYYNLKMWHFGSKSLVHKILSYSQKAITSLKYSSDLTEPQNLKYTSYSFSWMKSNLSFYKTNHCIVISERNSEK